jgi:hypothetical protein
MQRRGLFARQQEFKHRSRSLKLLDARSNDFTLLAI